MGDPPDPAYIRTVVGNYSWYDSSEAEQVLGYVIPELENALGSAVADIRYRMAGVQSLDALEFPPNRDDAQRWLITGVPGWLGNTVVRLLVERMRSGEVASAPIRLLVEPRFVSLIVARDGLEVVAGDLNDAASLDTAMRGVKTVCHIAGAIYPPKTEILYRVNRDGTQSVVDACIRAGVRRVLYVGTDSICGKGSRKQRIFDENTPARPYRHLRQE